MLYPLCTLNFDAAVLDSSITFTRAGATATRVNNNGFIELVAADVPRFDFDPITLGTNWFDVNTYTAPIEGTGFDPEFMYYRIGVKMGNYTSSTVDVRLGVPFPTSIRLNP